MILTFKGSHFELCFPPRAVLSIAQVNAFKESSGRLDLEKGIYKTQNIIEASRFRKFADNKAESIFKKLLLVSTPFPSGRPICPPDLTLMPFQIEKGIPHILTRNRSYLAHQPGLGKSAQSICAVAMKPGKTLIVCPSFLRVNWAREITKWFVKDFPEIAIVPETSKWKEMNWGADFVIVSDAMILKPWVQLGLQSQTFRFVFIDEAHRFKNHKSIRSCALFGGVTKNYKFKGLIYKSDHVCALSGTPMLNRPIELWSVLFAMAGETIDFMDYHDFGLRFANARQDQWGHWDYSGSSNLKELNERIMGRFMQRIRKDEVLTELPDKIREVVVMDQDPRSAEAKAFDQSLSRRIEFKNLEGMETMGDYAKLRHTNGLAKVHWVTEFVKEILENSEEQVLLFAHHRDVVEKLAAGFKEFNAMVIYGGQDMRNRVSVEDAFQSGKCQIIVGNIDAMNLGLTLTKATRVVFAEYAWTPALNEQAEDRAHRIGQKDSVFVQYVVLPDSMDETILNAILKKESAIERVIG